MKRISRKLSVVGGCTVALLALGGFMRTHAGDASSDNGARAAAYANLDPTSCSLNCPIVSRNQLGMGALNTLAAH